MFRRILLSLLLASLPFCGLRAEEYSENSVVLASAQGGESLVNVTDEEVDNLILQLENEIDETEREKQRAANPAAANDPYYDIKKALDNHNVKGLNKDIIVGMVYKKDIPTNLMSGVMMLYSSISNFFLHPLILFFIFVILALLVGTVLLGFIKFKKEDFVEGKKYATFAGIEIILAVYLVALMYEDFLGFTVYKKYLMGVLYVAISIGMGFVLGSIFSKFYFDDKILP